MGASRRERPLIIIFRNYLFFYLCIHKVIARLTYKQPFNHSFLFPQKPPAPTGVNLETSCNDAIALTTRPPILMFNKIGHWVFL